MCTSAMVFVSWWILVCPRRLPSGAWMRGACFFIGHLRSLVVRALERYSKECEYTLTIASIRDIYADKLCRQTLYVIEHNKVSRSGYQRSEQHHMHPASLVVNSAINKATLILYEAGGFTPMDTTPTKRLPDRCRR